MRLRAAGFRAEALNGDMSQPAREKTFNRFKARKTKILVATDVAARGGLDVPEITHVINYSIPMNLNSTSTGLEGQGEWVRKERP